MKTLQDETSLWELVVELQGTYGSFSSISVPETKKPQTEVQRAVEAEEIDQSSKLDAEKSVHDIPMNDIVDRLLILIESAADFFIFKGIVTFCFLFVYHLGKFVYFQLETEKYTF